MLFFLAGFANPKIPNYRFNNLTIKEGLSQSNARDIEQDNEGYLWIATQNGLNRYDGVEFLKFYQKDGDRQSLSSSELLSLASTKSSLLWVLSVQGLDSINTETFKVIRWSEVLQAFLSSHTEQKVNELAITQISLNNNDDLFVLTNNQILKVASSTQQISLLEGYQKFLNEEDTIDYFDINEKGQLLIIVEHCLLDIDLKAEKSIKTCAANGDWLSKIFAKEDNPNEVFLRVFDGFAVYNMQTKQLTTHKVYDSKGNRYVDVQDILISPHGYWLATNKGLKLWDPKQKKIIKEFHSNLDDQLAILNDFTLSLAKTNDGLIWVGSVLGVNYWNPEQQFRHLLKRSETKGFEAGNYVTSMEQDTNGDLWISAYSSGLYKYSDNHAVLEHFPFIKTKDGPEALNYAFKVFNDNNQNLWVLAYKGIFIKPLNSDIYLKIEGLEVDKKFIKFEQLNDIIQDRNGNIWLASYEGIYQLVIDYDDKGHISLDKISINDFSQKFPQELRDAYVLYEDLQGYIWAGGVKGLVRFNPQSFEYDYYKHDIDNSSSLSNTEINTIYEDLHGVLWIGTASGLNRVFSNQDGEIRFKRITVNDGLMNDYICSILSDEKGNLWISTLNGLIKYHPNNIDNVINYTYTDGLQYNEFYTGADFSDRNGALYFGGLNGITYFDPKSPLYNKLPQKIQFTSILQDGQLIDVEVDEGKEQIYALPDKVLDISIASFDFLNAKSYEYRYKLNDESSWQYLGNKRNIRLHSFQDDLDLEVQVKHFDGIWNTQSKTLSIKQKLTFWSSSTGHLILFILLLQPLIWILGFAYTKLSWILRNKDRKMQEEKGKQRILLDEKKNLLFQVEDLQYSLSEQRYLVEKLNNELEESTVMDMLTGLYTREYLRANVKNELRSILSTWTDELNTSGVHIGILAIEIDGFSRLNSDYGYLSGNEILKQVAESLRTVCYGTDILARWDNATLVVLSRGISQREQMVLAERIRNMVASRKFNLSNGGRIDITCSIGFTRFPFIDNNVKPLNWSQLIFIAEKALDVAKKNSLNAWVGIFSNQFTEADKIQVQLATSLPELIKNGQLDHVSSIPKAKKIVWD